MGRRSDANPRHARCRVRPQDFGQLKSPAPKSRNDRISIFKIYEKGTHEILLGEDDKHLDFRVSVLHQTRTVSAESAPYLVVSTVVHCHNRLGRIYIRLIAPFHRLIVQSNMRRAARAGWPVLSRPRQAKPRCRHAAMTSRAGGLVILIAAFYFIYAALGSYVRQSQAHDSFIPIGATVVEASVRSRGSTAATQGESFSPRIVYRYNVGGKTYQGDRYFFAGDGWRDAASAEAVVARSTRREARCTCMWTRPIPRRP